MSFIFENRLLVVFLVIVATALPFAAALLVHRRVLKRRDRCRSSWQLVREELARRHAIVPDLILHLRRLAPRSLLDSLYDANVDAQRAAGRPAAEVRAADALSEQLSTLVFDLPAGAVTEPLRREIARLLDNDDRLQGACRYYNALVKDLNECLQTFPSNFVAVLIGIPDEPYYEVTPLSTPRELARASG